LDAGAPHYSKFFRGWLGFDVEEEAEQIPVGFDSEKCFAEVDENGNTANGIRVEVMELNPVIVKKATKKEQVGRANPRSAKWKNVTISSTFSMGKGSQKEGRQLTRFFS
jgi:hypothetical protein